MIANVLVHPVHGSSIPVLRNHTSFLGIDRLDAALDRALELGLLAISSFPTHPCLIQFHASPPHTTPVPGFFSHDVDDGVQLWLMHLLFSPSHHPTNPLLGEQASV